jgi:hypothetical protein
MQEVGGEDENAKRSSPAERLAVQMPSLQRRRHLMAIGAAAMLAYVATTPALAEDDGKPKTLQECKKECNTECNAIGPGNEDYCTGNCDDFCANPNPLTSSLEVNVSKITVDCSGYKTTKAKQYCEEQNRKAIRKERDSELGVPTSEADANPDIYGGASTPIASRVQKLLAATFGATKQSDPTKVDVGGYVGDIGGAFKDIVSGK